MLRIFRALSLPGVRAPGLSLGGGAEAEAQRFWGAVGPSPHIGGLWGPPPPHSQAGDRGDSGVLMLHLGESPESGATGAERCRGTRGVCGAEGSGQHGQGSPHCPTQGFPRAGTRSPRSPGPDTGLGHSSGPLRTSRPFPGVVGEQSTRTQPRSPSLCRLLARPRAPVLGVESPCPSREGFLVRGVTPKPAMAATLQGQIPPNSPKSALGGVGGSGFIGWGAPFRPQITPEHLEPLRLYWDHLGSPELSPGWSQDPSLVPADVTRTLLGWQLPLGAPQGHREPSLGTVPSPTSWEVSASPGTAPNPPRGSPPGVPQWPRSHPVPTGAPRWPPPAQGLGFGPGGWLWPGGGHARLRRKGDKSEVPDPGKAEPGTEPRGQRHAARWDGLLRLREGTPGHPPPLGTHTGDTLKRNP